MDHRLWRSICIMRIYIIPFGVATWLDRNRVVIHHKLKVLLFLLAIYQSYQRKKKKTQNSLFFFLVRLAKEEEEEEEVGVRDVVVVASVAGYNKRGWK